jgi:thiosulfate/3-mercaptopyruvate sulfurtransferase
MKRRFLNPSIFKTIFTAVAISFFLAACQTKPTKVHETTTNVPVFKDTEVTITDQTVILDARPFFQYSNGHLPQAYPVKWDDFSQPGATIKGPLDPDSLGMARRLARLGITPDSEVVVVGNGKQGQGEEGRVAWTLAYLGIRKVQFVKESEIKSKRIAGQPGAIKNAPMWKPKLESALHVSPKQLLEAVKQITKPGAEAVLILDVRPPAEYLRATPSVDLGSINMDWKEFVDERGRPRRAKLKDLTGIGWSADRRIIVVSDNGVHSGLVTMSLRQMGYTNVGNFAAGLQSLSNTRLR